MRVKIPDSVVVAGHRDFDLLMAIRADLVARAGGLSRLKKEIPFLLREAIDVVIDTPRTGRRAYEDLEKTEKTYIGTRVEIFVRSFFELSKGRLDLEILGKDADVKFTTAGNWMIPREAVGKLCLVLAADEKRAKCFFGLIVARIEYLTAGKNQDKKRQISAEGFTNIMWLFCDHPLERNFWRTITEEAAEKISRQRTGNDRIVALFSEVQDRPIKREVVEAATRQKDFMRRIRADGGTGTRERLLKKGILLLSGKYDSDLIQALNLGVVDKTEFISTKLLSDEKRRIAGSYGVEIGEGEF